MTVACRSERLTDGIHSQSRLMSFRVNSADLPRPRYTSKPGGAYSPPPIGPQTDGMPSPAARNGVRKEWKVV